MSCQGEIQLLSKGADFQLKVQREKRDKTYKENSAGKETSPVQHYSEATHLLLEQSQSICCTSRPLVNTPLIMKSLPEISMIRKEELLY